MLCVLFYVCCSIECAHKKGGGSTKNGRDSESKRLGVKLYGGQKCIAGYATHGIFLSLSLSLSYSLFILLSLPLFVFLSLSLVLDGYGYGLCAYRDNVRVHEGRKESKPSTTSQCVCVCVSIADVNGRVCLRARACV